MVSNGVIVFGELVRQSVLSPGVRVDSWARVERSVILHNARIGCISQRWRLAALAGPDSPAEGCPPVTAERDRGRQDEDKAEDAAAAGAGLPQHGD